VIPWLAMTFGAAWGVAGAFAASGLKAEGIAPVVVGVLFLSSPMLTTLAWKRWFGREPFTEGALIVGPWLFVAWITPLVAAWIAALLAHALGWGVFDLSGEPIVARIAALRGEAEAADARAALAAAAVPYPLLASFQALITGLLLYAPLAFLEEVGWRGLAWRFLRPLGFWPAAVLNGVLWGLWRAPLVLIGLYFAEHAAMGAGAMLGACIPLGALLCWLREKSGSVWAPALAHGVLTGLTNFHELVLVGGDAHAVGVLGLCGGLVYLALAVGLFTWERLGAPRVAAAAR
jgi:uncharacterized protein